MKTTDVTPLTTIYAYQRRQHSGTQRVVVLDTGHWTPKYEGGRGWGGKRIGYEQIDKNAYLRSGSERGWLVLIEGFTPVGTEVISDEALLETAVQAKAAILAGDLPNLPDTLSLAAVNNRTIISTWSEHLNHEQASKEARLVQQAQQAERRAANDAAEVRIIATIGEDAVRPLRHMLIGRDTGWVELEKAMRLFAQAQ